MRVHVHGAAGEVTGSCTLVEDGGHRVHTVGGLSAHADQSGLLDWYGAFEGAPRVALVHGEERARMGLAAALRDRYGVDALLPRPGATIDVADARA